VAKERRSKSTYLESLAILMGEQATTPTSAQISQMVKEGCSTVEQDKATFANIDGFMMIRIWPW